MAGEDQGEGPPKNLEGWTEATADVVYTNSMAIAAGPFDVTLVFGQQDHSRGGTDQPPPAEEHVRVAMSWAHLKSMIPLMARVVAEYEEQFGEIPSPGFDQNWRA